MVAEHATATITEEDSNILCCSDSTDFHIGHSCKSIFDVVRTGEVCDIETLIEKLGPEALSSRDEWGYTPAHWAALDGNVEVMRYLVERSAPVDLSCLGTQGPRPIHWACRKGHTAVVQVLLSAGVAVNAPDFKGLTPLMTACMFGRVATAAFLLGMGAQNHLTDINGDTALHWAAYKGHADLIRLLTYSGVDLQKPDNFGSTPLHLACLSGNVSCVKLLCEKSKIELEPKDKNGKTPLLLAKSHRHSDIVQVLVTEKKRRARWMPPISEMWIWFFLFVMSVAVNCSFTIYFACYCLAIEGFEILYVLGLIEALVFCGLGWILMCSSILHACMNLTTNEMFNYKRYSYLRDKRGRYQNPFSRGPILNLLEFFICRPDYSNYHDFLEEESI